MEEINNNEAIKPATQSAISNDVYVMPDKFRLKNPSGSNWVIIISALILLLVIFLTGGYFAYDFWQKSLIIQKPTTEQQPPVIEIQKEEMMPLNPVITSTTSSTEEAISTSTATSTEELSTSTATSTETSEEIKFSLDSDNDGLTDIEEVIFGTAPANPDTDGDGYKDGVEVVNGYSPNKAGNVKLSDSPFISSIFTDFSSDNFELLYPKDWRISLAKASKQLVLTINTGEVITITVKDNTDKIPAMSWYLQQHPQTPVSDLIMINSRDLTGIYSSDGLSAYLTDGDKSKFYVFEYIIGKQKEFRYPAIFAMLIKQLLIIPNPGLDTKKSTTTSSQNQESIYTASTCGGFFCATSPCGLQPDGSNSCESNPPKGVCYLSACDSDLDCLNGLSCQEVNCYSGDTLISSMVCK